MRRNHYVHLYSATRRPFADVAGAFRNRSLPALAARRDVAIPEFHEGDAALDLDIGGVHVGKKAHIEVGEYVDVPGHIPLGRLQIRWVPADGSALVPEIHSAVEIEAIDEGRTMVSLLAWYDPPFGRLGRLVDRVAMHRVADGVMRHYFDELIDELSAA